MNVEDDTLVIVRGINDDFFKENFGNLCISFGGDSRAVPVKDAYYVGFDDQDENHLKYAYGLMYNPQIQISAESETKRSIFREKDKTKRSKKESAQHSKSRNKSFVMTSVSAL